MKQEQRRVRASLLPGVHISSPFQAWIVKPKQAQGSRAAGDLSLLTSNYPRSGLRFPSSL